MIEVLKGKINKYDLVVTKSYPYNGPNLFSYSGPAQSLQWTSFNLTHCLLGFLFWLCFILQSKDPSVLETQSIAWDLDNHSLQSLVAPAPLLATPWTRGSSASPVHQEPLLRASWYLCQVKFSTIHGQSFRNPLHFTIHPDNFYLTLSRFLCVQKRNSSITDILQFT